MSTVWTHTRWVIVAACLSALLMGCGEDAVVPEITGGAGITLTLPAGVDTLEGLRVELWHNNPVSPPHCGPAGLKVGAAAMGGDEPPFDTCTRMEVQIWDLSGERVLHVPDVACCQNGKFLSYGWNTRNDAGEDVPSGFYPARMACLDSMNPLALDPAGYTLIRDREKTRCEWPVWIREPAADEVKREMGFGPFKTAFSTVLLGEHGESDKLVSFTSPFMLRVHADGMEVFEREVMLVDERIERVTVAFVPQAPVTRVVGKD